MRIKLVLDTSFAFTAHLTEAGIDASISTVDDFVDNAVTGCADG